MLWAETIKSIGFLDCCEKSAKTYSKNETETYQQSTKPIDPIVSADMG